MATAMQVQDGATVLPELLSAPELAEYVGVPLSTIYHWRSRGRGPHGFRVGKQVRFRASDVAAWLEDLERREAPGGAGELT
jgi:excisionase family DNA binding protein